MNKYVNFSWQIKKMEDFEITIRFINVEVIGDHHRSNAKGSGRLECLVQWAAEEVGVRKKNAQTEISECSYR